MKNNEKKRKKIENPNVGLSIYHQKKLKYQIWYESGNKLKIGMNRSTTLASIPFFPGKMTRRKMTKKKKRKKKLKN